MIFSFSHALVTVTLILSSAPGVKANRCDKISEIFEDGKEMVEKMWSDSFEVVEDEDKGYTMWFDKKLDVNPNNEITKNLFGLKNGYNDTIDKCHLNADFHKEMVTEEEVLNVCRPWRNKGGCCSNEYVGSKTQMNTNYGKEYHWDRCGKLSKKCEKYFVQEACFYECEPAAGLYRKHMDPESHPEWAKHDHKFTGKTNEWQMYKMPIKKTFSDDWYEACKDDYFCAEGDFFSCAKAYNTTLEVCGDDPTKGKLNDMGYTCAKLAKKSSKLEKRCGNSLVRETCPETCDGTCKCTDDGNKKWDYDSKKYTCKDLAKFSSRRRAKKCETSYASARCPGTCEGWCTKKNFK